MRQLPQQHRPGPCLWEQKQEEAAPERGACCSCRLLRWLLSCHMASAPATASDGIPLCRCALPTELSIGDIGMRSVKPCTP